MRTRLTLGLLTALAAAAVGQEKVFLVVEPPAGAKGNFTGPTLVKDMTDALTKARRTMPERHPFGGFTPVQGKDAKSMFADAVKAGAAAILHVQVQDSGKDKAKKVTLTAQYTLYEPKKDADPDKPQQYWQKGATQALKSAAPEVDPDDLAGKVLAGKHPHDATQLMAVDLRAALVKRVAANKGMDGKADKGTLTVTVTVQNTGKAAIRGLVLALPHEDYVNYAHSKAEIEPGKTDKVTFTIKDAAAAKLVWKNAKLAEVYTEKPDKEEPKKK